MIGRRVDAGENPDQYPYPQLQTGEYGKDIQGRWFAIPPGCPELLANISGHKIVEHEDGTITVEPSILVQNHTGKWHGYLRRGIWIEC